MNDLEELLAAMEPWPVGHQNQQVVETVVLGKVQLVSGGV
jgi:hypothetical protein